MAGFFRAGERGFGGTAGFSVDPEQGRGGTGGGEAILISMSTRFRWLFYVLGY